MKNRLKELRMDKKLSQIKVQMDTGIEQALLSKYENGVRIPPTETLKYFYCTFPENTCALLRHNLNDVFTYPL